MSIKTSSTNAHLQRATPKPLRKAGLHSIEISSPIYGDVQPIALTRPAATPIRNSTMRGDSYHCPEMAPSVRPGAMDAYRLPSGGYEEQAARARVEARRAAKGPAGQMIPLRRRAV